MKGESILKEKVIVWRYFDYFLQFILLSGNLIDYDFLYSKNSIEWLKKKTKLFLIFFDRIYIPLQDILFAYNPLACELIKEFFNDKEIQELTEKGIITFSTWTNKALPFKELHDQDDAFWQVFLEPVERSEYSKDYYKEIRRKIRKVNITLNKDNIFQRKPTFQSQKLFNLICNYLRLNYIHQSNEDLKETISYFLETVRRQDPSIWLIENPQINLKAPFSKERFVSFLTGLLEPKLPRKEKIVFKKTLSIIKKTNIIHQIEKCSIEAILTAHQKENTEVFILSYYPIESKLPINNKVIDFNLKNLLSTFLQFVDLELQDFEHLIIRTSLSSIISNREALYHNWKLFQANFFEYFTFRLSGCSYFENALTNRKKESTNDEFISSNFILPKFGLKNIKNMLKLIYNLDDILKQIRLIIKKEYYRKLIKSILN